MPEGLSWLHRRGRLLRRSRTAALPVPDGGEFAVTVLESTSALVCVVDLGGRVVFANPALLCLTGYENHELVGRPIFDTLVIPEDLVPARAALLQAVTAAAGPTGSVEADWLDRHGGRHRIHMHSSALPSRNGEARAVAYIGTDVTEQRQLQTELRERAETDALTGLRNRTAMLTALHAALVPKSAFGSEPVGLLFCDLDGFKTVNDHHGHLVGDALLIEVGQRLLALTQPPQVVSRLGGDEFLILIPSATPTSLAQLGRAVTRAIQRSYLTRQGEVTIGVSVGTALGRAGDDPTELIAQADRCMYGVKTSRAGPRGTSGATSLATEAASSRGRSD